MKTKADLLLELKPFLDILEKIESFEKKTHYFKFQLGLLYFGILALTASLLSHMIYSTGLSGVTIFLFLNGLGIFLITISISIYIIRKRM